MQSATLNSRANHAIDYRLLNHRLGQYLNDPHQKVHLLTREVLGPPQQSGDDAQVPSALCQLPYKKVLQPVHANPPQLVHVRHRQQPNVQYEMSLCRLYLQHDRYDQTPTPHRPNQVVQVDAPNFHRKHCVQDALEKFPLAPTMSIREFSSPLYDLPRGTRRQTGCIPVLARVQGAVEPWTPIRFRFMPP